MRRLVAIRSLLFALFLMSFSVGVFAQIGVGISVNFGPPAIPVYEQPICPQEGYIWTPGYWYYGDGEYFWVPGTWVLAPEPGFLWTPGYWGWGGSAFFWHAGYWGPHIGFYGGINYGFGYFGHGYDGGRWENNHFYYNTYVNHVNTTIIHNTYNTRIENVNVNRVSYNGGSGGIEARPTPQEESFDKERHVGPVAAQNQHVEQARGNPQLRASNNHGKPPIAATTKPGEFNRGTVAAKEAGGEYKAPARSDRPPTANTHASELQQHQYTAPQTGNSGNDKKYQQQQDKLAAKQNQEHQKLQQQQEKEHQQMQKTNASEAQKQQLEQKHAQQTQQMEQKHAAQQQKVQTHQQPPQHESTPKH